MKKDFISFREKNPDLIVLFENPNDCDTHSYGSKAQVIVTCPFCLNKQNTTYYLLSRNNFHCKYCGDTLTYPNRFLRVLLQELQGITNIQYEKSFKIDNKIIRVDGVFTWEDKKIAIEMNGLQHYANCSYNNYDVQEQVQRDKQKKDFLQDNGYIYIAIDCRKSSFLYIKQQLLISKLNEYFDLENINWENIYANLSNFSLLRQICEDYEKNNMPTIMLSKKYSLDRHRIANYLQEGKNLNLCPSYPRSAIKGQTVLAYDKDKNFIGKYYSYAQCAEELKKIYNLTFLPNSISHVISGAQKTHRNFYFVKGDDIDE